MFKVLDGLDGRGVVLMIVDTDDAREALSVYSISQGFADYDQPETRDFTYDLPGGVLGAVFTNYEIFAVRTDLEEPAGGAYAYESRSSVEAMLTGRS